MSGHFMPRKEATCDEVYMKINLYNEDVK